jgi:hypothetical protein
VEICDEEIAGNRVHGPAKPKMESSAGSAEVREDRQSQWPLGSLFFCSDDLSVVLLDWVYDRFMTTPKLYPVLLTFL